MAQQMANNSLTSLGPFIHLLCLPLVLSSFCSCMCSLPHEQLLAAVVEGAYTIL